MYLVVVVVVVVVVYCFDLHMIVYNTGVHVYTSVKLLIKKLLYIQTINVITAFVTTISILFQTQGYKYPAASLLNRVHYIHEEPEYTGKGAFS